jgi:DNA-binding MarR family transcriptional regulator
MTNKDNFLEFAESLKLVRKTRIEDFVNDKTIDDIYTDLLPNNGIITRLNLPRTTILVGRKGTGKSTIFQKSQKDLVANKRCISIYIDVKSLYDNSTPSIPQEAQELNKEFQKYLIYSNLIREIIIETKNRLDDFVKVSILNRILGFDSLQIEEINIELEEIENSINDVIKQVDGSLVKNFKQINELTSDNSKNLNLKVSSDPSFEISDTNKSSANIKTEFESTLVNYLDIKKSLISKLTKLKKILGIEHLYIFLDDYSEIDEEAQKIFMDWFIAPLNNLSDDFVKFKIAVYPHRFYYGMLDNSKIDEISLEFFDAFYTFEKETNISKMEMLALDYTKRLLKKRLNLFFPNNHWDKFFAIPEEELFDILFSVSFNNPRKIGYLLSYCHESCLIHNSKITKEAIENASKRYFNDVTLKYFLANQFVTRPFVDKISNEHQYELLNKIIERQKINSSTTNRTRIKGKPANHFVVNKEISGLLDNLELNGFITTYNNINDNNSNLSIIYSLDFGLCKSNSINFNRAYNTRLLQYFSQSRFNMNVLISDYFNKTQLLRCRNNHEFPYEMLDSLKKFKMRCPDCIDNGIMDSFCEVSLSDSEIRDKLKNIESKRLDKISYYEFLILDYLGNFEKTVSINKISTTIDKSEDTVKSNINKLIEKDLVFQDIPASRVLKKEIYSITKKGKEFHDIILKMIKETIEKNKISN